MIDTIQITRTLIRPPDESLLIKNGWIPRFNGVTGQLGKFILNEDKGSLAPRSTILRDLYDRWFLRTEVSPTAWRTGSNIDFLNESDFFESLRQLSEFVTDKSKLNFNAFEGRVTRVDFTRDFYVGEHLVLPIIARFNTFNLPRYKRSSINGESVCFTNSGKRLSKQYKIYSKYHERLANSKISSDYEKSRAVLRLEISLRYQAVYGLANSLNLKSILARDILNYSVAKRVIENAMHRLHFKSFLRTKKPDYTAIFEKNGPKSFGIIGYYYLKDLYPENFPDYIVKHVSKKTLQRIERSRLEDDF